MPRPYVLPHNSKGRHTFMHSPLLIIKLILSYLAKASTTISNV